MTRPARPFEEAIPAPYWLATASRGSRNLVAPIFDSLDCTPTVLRFVPKTT